MKEDPVSKPTRSSFNEVMFTCPACDTDVRAHVVVDISVESYSGKVVKAGGTILGVQVSHDCVPKTTR
jgi:hypothetical protein